jgi:hypothetical protein
VVLQRAVLICLMMCLPITLFWTRITGAILALGQPHAIAAGAGAYLWRVAPALWLMALSECLKRWAAWRAAAWALGGSGGGAAGRAAWVGASPTQCIATQRRRMPAWCALFQCGVDMT